MLFIEYLLNPLNLCEQKAYRTWTQYKNKFCFYILAIKLSKRLLYNIKNKLVRKKLQQKYKTEHYETFLKENEDDLNKWKDTHFYGAKDNNTIKMATQHK